MIQTSTVADKRDPTRRLAPILTLLALTLIAGSFALARLRLLPTGTVDARRTS